MVSLIAYKCELTGVCQGSKPSFSGRRLGFCTLRRELTVLLWPHVPHYFTLLCQARPNMSSHLLDAWFASQSTQFFDVWETSYTLSFWCRLSSSAVRLFIAFLKVSVGLKPCWDGWLDLLSLLFFLSGVQAFSRTRVCRFFVTWGSHGLHVFFDWLFGCYDRLRVSRHRGYDLACHSKFLCLI